MPRFLLNWRFLGENFDRVCLGEIGVHAAGENLRKVDSLERKMRYLEVECRI